MRGSNNKKEIKGQRFGRLIALEEVGRDKQGYVLWKCQCDCGNEKIASTKYLGRGTSSCGCIAREMKQKQLTKHGKRYTRLYATHRAIMQRCTNPNLKAYANYGARGIKICDEWKDSFEVFEKWAYENGYDDSLTIDRIDHNGDYEPSNCRWVNMKTQQRNKRSNVRISYKGEEHCLSEWAEIFGIRYGTFLKRFYAGWSMERIATTPIQVR